MPRHAWVAVVLGVSCSVGGTPESSRPVWQLVWHDEFDGATLDAGKWVRETGGNGWGNAELEFYTDRKSTRLNSSHDQISYAVFCLKKKKIAVTADSLDDRYGVVC